MNYQGLHIRHIGKERENLQTINKLEGLLLTALNLKCEDRAAAIRKILLIESMIRMLWQTWMINLGYLWILYQIINNLLGVFRVTLQAKGQGLSALQQQEGRKRRNSRTLITEQNSTNVDSKCSLAGSLSELYAVVARICLGNPRILATLCPVKVTAVHDNTAQSSTMTTNKLGCRMNNYICTMLNRTDKVWRAEGVINYQRQPMLVSQLGNGINIRNIGVWIAQGLNVDGLGIILNSPFDFL